MICEKKEENKGGDLMSGPAHLHRLATTKVKDIFGESTLSNDAWELWW